MWGDREKGVLKYLQDPSSFGESTGPQLSSQVSDVL